MYPMFSAESQNIMVQYQTYLEKMNAEAVEYVRGIPVTKAFQQSVYSFKNFIDAIRNYGKFSANYSLSTQLPMTAFTVSINGFFALLIPAGILLAGSLVDRKFLADFMFYVIFTPVCENLKYLQNLGITSFIITHDFELICESCSHIIHLDDGKIIDNYNVDDKKLRDFFLNQ